MQALIDALSQYPMLALGAVFAAALLESVAIIGTVFPGSSVVVIGGVLVGLAVLDPWWTMLVAVTGATLGDGMSYWLGRHYHTRLLGMWPLKNYPALFEQAQAYFARNGGKSVFLGRFLGPVRAIVPVIAGMSDMPVLPFTLMNVLSAIVWAGLHLLPGALLGASLQLAGAVSSRLLILLLGVALTIWLGTVLLRLAHRRIWPLVIRQRDHMAVWALARPGLPARVIRSLLYPSRAASPGLLIAALLLLGGAGLFLGILEDVVSNDPLVQFDQVVFTTLQNLRTAWADEVMIIATELGSAMVAVTVIAAVSVLLALKRCWRTLAYWLAAVGFAQALVWMLKLTLGRARPITMYAGMDPFSFPSGHAASSVVLYGFLAVLLARGKSPRVRWAIAGLAVLLVGLISFSRLYLGAHWLSDVLASLSLGASWVALLSIAYLQHVRGEHLPTRALLLTALAALVLAGSGMVATHRAADMVHYAPRQAAAPLLLADWQSQGWLRLPTHRTEVDGDPEEPLSIQWSSTADRIAQVLQADGWRHPPSWKSPAALLWLLPSTPIGELPVLAKFHQGEPPTLSFERELDPSQRLVIRLWHTSYRAGTASDPGPPLWIGLVTRERLTHPTGFITLAKTDPDFGAPTAELVKRLQSHSVTLDVRHRNGVAVLLMQ